MQKKSNEIIWRKRLKQLFSNLRGQNLLVVLIPNKSLKTPSLESVVKLEINLTEKKLSSSKGSNKKQIQLCCMQKELDREAQTPVLYLITQILALHQTRGLIQREERAARQQTNVNWSVRNWKNWIRRTEALMKRNHNRHCNRQKRQEVAAPRSRQLPRM